MEKIEDELKKVLPPVQSGTPDKSGAVSLTETLTKKVFPGLKQTTSRDTAGTGCEAGTGNKAVADCEVSDESINALFIPGADILYRGGKRWRPLLMTLICESLGGGDTALPLTPLVELCHNASLIHDDIEDNSDERRGKPAVHHIYGVDTAINSGTFLYFLASICIESWTGDKSEIYRLWAEYMRKLHLGQAMDINWHRNFAIIPSVEEYYTMCGLKTGCLARFAAAIGIYAAGTVSKTQGTEKLEDAAEKLGVGFQILDDVKNLKTGVPGKKRGDDIVEGKKSLPILLFLHQNPEKQEFVYNCFTAAREKGVNAPEVEELIQALTQAGVLDKAERKGLELIAGAREVFSAAAPDQNNKSRALLANFTELIS